MDGRKKHGRVTSPEGAPRESLSGGGGDGRTRPELARRRANRKSALQSGRTIGEAREHLETANERAAARKKDKKKATRRIIFTIFGFLILIAVLAYLTFTFFGKDNELPLINAPAEEQPTYAPTIEVVDQDASATSGEITSRMSTFIGQAEASFRELGYIPVRAVIPSGAIREVDFYLDGYTGFIKMSIDRGSAVSVEDADRLIRYLAGQGTKDFTYLDLRLPGKAYWK